MAELQFKEGFTEEVITKLRAVEVELSPPIIPHLCTQ